MRLRLLLILQISLVACTTAQRPEGTALSDGSTSYTLTCEDGWGTCYKSAQKICGNVGFEEIDRAADGKVTSAGHLARVHTIDGKVDDHVYSENPRAEVFHRVLTIRCKQR